MKKVHTSHENVKKTFNKILFLFKCLRKRRNIREQKFISNFTHIFIYDYILRIVFMCIHNCKDLSLKKKKNFGMWGKQKKIIVKVEYPKSKPAEFLSSLISFRTILLTMILFVGSYFECDLKTMSNSYYSS